MSDMNMSEDAAEKEFERWAEFHGIKTAASDVRIQGQVQKAKERMIKAFISGELVLDDSGVLEYTISGRSPQGFAGEKVRISGMTGKAWMAMDKYGENEQIHQLIATASAVTGKDVGWFGNLANPDFLLFTNVIALFMNA